jgi:hypothetical protein
MSSRMIIGAVLLAPVCISGMAKAQTVEKPIPAAIYSSKFLCGFQRPPTGGAATGPAPTREPAVKPGNYATAINVQNFHHFPVTFCKRAVLAPAERCYEKQGDDSCLKAVVGKPISFTLQSSQAVSIDCKDIVTLLGGTVPAFIEGFVEISVAPQSNLSLSNPISVTGVYTSLGCTLTPGVNECPRVDGAGLDVVPQNSFAGEASDCKTTTN